MKKFGKIIVSLAVIICFSAQAFAANPKGTNTENVTAEPTTRNDAVIFKIHDIKPVDEEGVVTGCDFLLTLYNRTAINFRSFTMNFNWKDDVEENFKFDAYVEAILGTEEAIKQKKYLADNFASAPTSTKITVNAFGADTQISVKSHIDSEKCYLLLKKADFSVTPCDIVRDVSTATVGKAQECTALFQFVDTSNPEYFGKFKDISATEIANQSKSSDMKEMSDIDVVISKIVENIGASGQALAEIN